jgi:hypothetical protein
MSQTTSPTLISALVLGWVITAGSACSSDDPASADAAPDTTVVDLAALEGGGAGSDGGLDGPTSQRCLASAELVARIDPARLKAHLEALVGLGERRSHAAQTQAAAYLRSKLVGIPGATVEDHTYSFKGQSYANIVVSFVGASKPDEHVFIGAHYDSNSNDPTQAPGADDNATGAAAMLELARALGGCQPARSVRVLFFSNEEQGIIGSSAYVKHIKSSVAPSDLVGFINVDMIGFGPANEDLDLATRTVYAPLAHRVRDAVEAWTSLGVVEHIDDHCG